MKQIVGPLSGQGRRRRRGVRVAAATVVALGATVAVTACGSSSDDSSAASGDGCTLNFVATVPLTGDAAVWGKAVSNGYSMAFDEINAAGGITAGPRKGCKLKFTKLDTQSDTAKATTLAQDIVSSGDKYFGSLGTIESAALMAQMPIFERAKMPVGEAYAASAEITTSGFDQIFRMVADMVENGRHAAKNVVASVDGKRIAVVKSDGDYSDSTFRGFKEEAAKQGLELVQVSTFDSGSTKFSAIVTKLANLDLDGLMVIGYPADTGNLVRQVRAAGIDLPIVADGGSSAPTFTELARDAAEGVFTSTIFAVDGDDPEVNEFSAKFKEKFGDAPHESAAYAYDLGYVIANALNEGVDKREELAAKVRSLTVDGVTGETRFNDAGQVIGKSPTRVVVKDGKFVPIPDDATGAE